MEWAHAKLPFIFCFTFLRCKMIITPVYVSSREGIINASTSGYCCVAMEIAYKGIYGDKRTWSAHKKALRFITANSTGSFLRQNTAKSSQVRPSYPLSLPVCPFSFSRRADIWKSSFLSLFSIIFFGNIHCYIERSKLWNYQWMRRVEKHCEIYETLKQVKTKFHCCSAPSYTADNSTSALIGLCCVSSLSSSWRGQNCFRVRLVRGTKVR